MKINEITRAEWSLMTDEERKKQTDIENKEAEKAEKAEKKQEPLTPPVKRKKENL